MDVFYYLCYVLAFSSDHGYRIKVFGDNEEYIVQVKDKVRVSKIIDFEDVPEVKSVFRLVNTGPDKYKLKVCENYITAKEPDPGIIISEDDDTNYTEWVLDKDGDKGYILKNELKDQCLTVTDHFDPSTNGFYMNRRGCSGSLPNVFNFIDAGLLNHFCKADAKSFCKNLERKEKYKKQRKNEEKRKGGSGNFGIESSSSDDSSYDDDSSDERNDRPKKRNRDRRPVDDYDDRPKKRNRDKRPVDDYDDRPKKRDRDRSPRYDDGPKKRNRDRRPVDDYDDDLSSDEIDRPRRREPKRNRWDDDASSYDQDERPKRITGSEPSSDEIPERESRRKPSKRRPKSKKHHDRHHGDMSEHEYHHGNDDDDSE